MCWFSTLNILDTCELAPSTVRLEHTNNISVWSGFGANCYKIEWLAWMFQVKRDMVAIKQELDTVQQVKEEIEELREYVDRLEEHSQRRKLRLLEQVMYK